MLKAAPVPRNEARGERLCYQTPGHIPWEGLVKDAMASAVHSAGELEIKQRVPRHTSPEKQSRASGRDCIRRCLGPGY